MFSYLVILAFIATYPAGGISYTTSVCGQYQWACQDKRTCILSSEACQNDTVTTCISSSQKCDGKVDCRDGSDESHAVCWNNPMCKYYEFRCTYGACVDGDWPCNGVSQCRDGSDELLPRCRNETAVVHATFKCKNGETIPSDELCDGRVNCADGSDETLESCAGQHCRADLFQCEYGACVDADAACDPYGIMHCADGSDEAYNLCNIKDNRPSKFCILPESPDFMSYTVMNRENASVGDGFRKVFLEITCSENRTAVSDYARCEEGFWSMKMSQCPKDCKVPINEGVKYMCPGYFSSQKCKDTVPNGTLVDPACEIGYNQENPRLIQCVDGEWDHDVKCERTTSSCGIPIGAQPMMMGGKGAKNYEVPWHAGIYDKDKDYKQICGGSLVSHNLVISAAHCFWDDVAHQLPHTRYAVALGQLKRQWRSDEYGQWFNVSSIKLHDSFRAEAVTWGYDIALVFLDRPAVYDENIKPVCLDLYNSEFNQRQLAHGQLGKIAGWGLTAEDGDASDELITNEIPTMNNSVCIDNSPPDFKKYITADKICAGNETGNALCQGDSGGGLVFRDKVTGAYYLQGIASIRPINNHACSKEGYTAFTRVFLHADFIKTNDK